MTDHDPAAVEVLAIPRQALTHYCQSRYRDAGPAFDPDGGLTVWGAGALDAMTCAVNALTAANLAVVKVDEVPPWMRKVADAEQFGHDLYVIREDTP